MEAKETTLEHDPKALPGTVCLSEAWGTWLTSILSGCFRARGSEALLFAELLALCNS